jgi:hypothetical protein
MLRFHAAYYIVAVALVRYCCDECSACFWHLLYEKGVIPLHWADQQLSELLPLFFYFILIFSVLDHVCAAVMSSCLTLWAPLNVCVWSYRTDSLSLLHDSKRIGGSCDEHCFLLTPLVWEAGSPSLSTRVQQLSELPLSSIISLFDCQCLYLQQVQGETCSSVIRRSAQLCSDLMIWNLTLWFEKSHHFQTVP